MNSSEIEPINYGPAAITMDAGEKGIEVTFGTIITGKDVINTPLQISEVEEHTCKFDEKTGKASRTVNGVEMKVDSEKMKKIRNQRRLQKRPIKTTRRKDDIEK